MFTKKMADQNRNKALTMPGQVGRLREGEKFYKDGMKLPFTVVDPYHKMGIKCHHPRRKGYSYFQPEVYFAVDLRFAPISFVGRQLATPQEKTHYYCAICLSDIWEYSDNVMNSTELICKECK